MPLPFGRRGPRTLGLTLAAALTAAGMLAPVGAAEELWGEIAIPGGIAAARELTDTVGPYRAPASYLLDVHRRFHRTSAQAVDRRAEPFERFQQYLADLAEHLKAWPDGLAVSAASSPDRGRRDAFREVIEQLGLRLSTSRSQATVELADGDADRERHRWLALVGADVADAVKKLNGGETVKVTWPTDVVPLPLPGLWRVMILKDRRPPIVQIVTNSSALLLYAGLASLDTETLRWVELQPRVFERLYDNAAALASFGSSLRIRDGRIEPPGGPAWLPVWLDFVDAPVTNPERFIDHLLGRDAGRLAYFYDTIDTLDPARQAFMLGTPPASSRNRDRDLVRSVGRVYDHFAGIDSTWTVQARPLHRPETDPALAAMLVDVTAAGNIGPEWWPSLFDYVESETGWPEKPAQVLRRLAVRPADAPWLFAWIFAEQARARQRLSLVRFAQRRFATVPRDAAPDLALALITRRDMPALALAVDRMRVTDVKVFAALGAAASRLTRAGEGDAELAAVRSWQSALALVEQVTRHRPLPDATLSKVLLSLAQAAPLRSGTPNGLVAAWLFDEFLPAAAGPLSTSEALEESAIEDLLRDAEAPSGIFKWEGLEYRLDSTGPVVTSAIAIRRAMMGPRLDHLFALVEVERRLAKGLRTIEEVTQLADALEKLVPALTTPADANGQPTAIGDDVDSVVRRLRRIKNARDVPRASRERPTLLRSIDAASAAVLPPVVYALAMSPSTQPAGLYADGPRTHDLSPAADDVRAHWHDVAWRPPMVVVRREGGTLVRGALLGLDLARAHDQLRRTGTAAPPAESSITEGDREIFSERVVFRPTSAEWNADGARIVEGLTKGRARLGAWKQKPPSERELMDALAAASVSPQRRNLVWWALQRGRWQDVDQLIGPTDIYRLGSAEPLPVSFGQPGRFLDGCWCLWSSRGPAFEAWVGRQSGQAASVTTDAQVRLAGLLADAGLPSALVGPLLPVAMRDLVDHTFQFSIADTDAFGWVRALSAERLDDYLQSLIAERVLAPPREAEAIRREPR